MPASKTRASSSCDGDSDRDEVSESSSQVLLRESKEFSVLFVLDHVVWLLPARMANRDRRIIFAGRLQETSMADVTSTNMGLIHNELNR